MVHDDDSHWDLDDRLRRDEHREPAHRRPRPRKQLTPHGTVRVSFERDAVEPDWLRTLRNAGLI